MRVRPGGLCVSIAIAVGLLACSSSSEKPAATSPTTGATTRATTSTAPARPTSKIVAGSELKGDAAFLGQARTVVVGKATIAYRQLGRGPDILLIAGQASPMSLWPVSLLAWLATDHRITIYDNRDLGSSTDSANGFTLGDLADDAAGLIGALALDHPAVFGWSTGGEIGLLLASRHPNALSSLAITGATPGGPRSVLPPPKVIALFADPNADTAALLDVLFSPAGKAAQDAFIADYLKVPQSTVSAAATKEYDDAEHAYWDGPEPRWSSITVPVLVMNGNEDYAVPPANARFIAAKLGTRAKLDIDPGGRHAWFLEHPSHFRARLTSFLS